LEPEEAANAFYQNVWKLHGLPDDLTSDRGTQFTSEFWQLICKRLRVKPNLSTAYHPETDGQTERVNAIMEHYLRAYVNYLQDDWAQWLPGAEFAANNTNSSSILASPFLANYGQHPRVGFEPEEPLPQDLTVKGRANLVAANEFVKRMENLDEHLRE
jgi:transposase InsO family protein